MPDQDASAEPDVLWADGLVVLLLFAGFLGLVTAMFGPPDLQGLATLAGLGCAALAGLARLAPVRRWRAARKGRGKARAGP